MYKGKKILAVILARGGSKGVKKKNIRLINNYPLIYYTIKEALKSKYIDKLVVSTDNLKIKSIAKKFGAEVPFIRPKKLATDRASSASCLIHALKKYEYITNDKFEILIELMCTNPLKKSFHFDKIIEMIVKKNADTVTSVVKVDDYHPRRIKKLTKSGLIRDFLKEKRESRRQDLRPLAYVRNGSIYAMKREIILKGARYGVKKSYAYIMDPKYSINIDNENDFLMAEILLKRNKN